ncbi:MAG: PD-(D/E)XK nuclease family protein [Anaerolineae bacterium]|nr:PD-(D/E)XK nuclease family protein [Anaerolineae bacterium]
MTSWSVSLDKTWSRCQRQYFFYLMASSTASDKQRNRAQFLKDMMAPEVWHGTLVHKVIEDIILPPAKKRHWLKPEEVIPEAIDLAKRQFTFSLNKSYERTTKKLGGDNYAILMPHYLGISNNRDILDEAIDVISYALRNLLQSQRMKAFLLGRLLYRIEKFHHFKVGDKTLSARPDLIMANKNRGGFDVVDWKVATTSGRYDFQVGVYALGIRATDWLFQHL